MLPSRAAERNGVTAAGRHPDLCDSRVSRTLKEVYVGDLHRGGAVPEMEACWPSSVVLRGRALNHPVLRWLKTVVVSDRGEGAVDASGGDQEDVPESTQPEVLGVGVRC
jgi:hypothetical protein